MSITFMNNAQLGEHLYFLPTWQEKRMGSIPIVHVQGQTCHFFIHASCNVLSTNFMKEY